MPVPIVGMDEETAPVREVGGVVFLTLFSSWNRLASWTSHARCRGRSCGTAVRHSARLLSAWSRSAARKEAASLTRLLAFSLLMLPRRGRLQCLAVSPADE